VLLQRPRARCLPALPRRCLRQLPTRSCCCPGGGGWGWGGASRGAARIRALADIIGARCAHRTAGPGQDPAQAAAAVRLQRSARRLGRRGPSARVRGRRGRETPSRRRRRRREQAAGTPGLVSPSRHQILRARGGRRRGSNCPRCPYFPALLGKSLRQLGAAAPASSLGLNKFGCASGSEKINASAPRALRSAARRTPNHCHTSSLPGDKMRSTQRPNTTKRAKTGQAPDTCTVCYSNR